MAHRTRKPIITPMNRPLHVVVAGGGPAAAEALLALRAHAADRVTLELITPSPSMPFRPASTAAPFADADADVPRYDLAALTASIGAALRTDAVEAVAPAARRLRLASGASAGYDMLVLALGARARKAVPGALTFRDQRDVGRLRTIVDELRSGLVERIAVAVPAPASWPLPAYEIALQLASTLEDYSREGEITIVTPEHAPLEVFGHVGTAVMAGLLAERAVRLVPDARPWRVDRKGLHLTYGGVVAADAVIALPGQTGRRIPGIPSGFGGFVATGPTGRVDGIDDVWAVGDMTAFPVKQGGVAAQQADTAATDIARLAGADPHANGEPGHIALRAQVFGAGRPLFLRGELDALGRPVGEALVDGEPPWWPVTKLHGHFLAPWMAEQALAA
jgi:sulfide:quinone oxidoreductase